MSNDADEQAGQRPDAPTSETALEPARNPGQQPRVRAIRRSSRRQRDDERFAERVASQFAAQWAVARAERRPEPAPIESGPTNMARAQVPWALDLAASWAWRFVVIAGALYAVLWVLAYFAVITLPLVIAMLIAALGNPAVRAMQRIGIRRGAGAGLIVVGGLGLVTAMLTFVGTQVVNGVYDLADQVADGLGTIRAWVRDGPLNASDSQINGWLKDAQDSITSRTQDAEVFSQVTEVGTALTHVVAGFFIVLFATYFFLADGHRIWAWAVRMFPRAARERVDSSGRIAWTSLTQFVRATVMVALVDAVGIMAVAAILGVPLIVPIGVLVFLGAFVPMIGATIAGLVAILVALVAQGPIAALLMLGGVILVQQIEGHVLQPFLMGRFVSLHPLGVIIAIGCGVIVAGIAGALIAVPLAAVVNAVGLHLAAGGEPSEDREDPELALARESGPDPGAAQAQDTLRAGEGTDDRGGPRD
ncbi:AI-2E family transporter [Nocardioides donggukensis]|uniref:AI-2E family transporter n=1 Tax=Nocardioides donggukensis TaxID=2774019 RepID=UPI00191E392B|nr:AI-2E family transporter [Nocardioides donggukensis]